MSEKTAVCVPVPPNFEKRNTAEESQRNEAEEAPERQPFVTHPLSGLTITTTIGIFEGGKPPIRSIIVILFSD